MAAFTTLALLGLAAGGAFTAGTALANKKKNPDEESMTGDPNGPHAKLGDAPIAPPTPPATVTQNAANAQGAAAAAAARARKRAAAGSTLLDKPLSSRTPASAKLQPKSLVGY